MTETQKRNAATKYLQRVHDFVTLSFADFVEKYGEPQARTFTPEVKEIVAATVTLGIVVSPD